MSNENGFLEALGIFCAFFAVVFLIFAIFFIRFRGSQSVVSGIVYNTETNHLMSGNTTFAVRASVDTFIYHNSDGSTNESDFCLPPHSPYEKLVEKAAADKNVKVIVTSNKYFAIQAPWTCKANVTVTEEK